MSSAAKIPLFRVSRPLGETAIPIASLRRRIAEIEGREVRLAESIHESPWTFGLDEIDAALGGLPPAALHETGGAGPRDGPAAAGFVLALLARRLASLPRQDGRVLLWCGSVPAAREHGCLYGPGLQALGLSPDRLLFVRGRKDKDVLWAMEEGVRSRAVAAVVGEIGAASFTATRRLALASQDRRVPSLLVRASGEMPASAAATRWRVRSETSALPLFDARAPGTPRWRLDLVRCRGGQPRTWVVEWSYETGSFRLAAALAARPLAADIRRAG